MFSQQNHNPSARGLAGSEPRPNLVQQSCVAVITFTQKTVFELWGSTWAKAMQDEKNEMVEQSCCISDTCNYGIQKRVSQETTEVCTCPAGWYLPSSWVTFTLAARSSRYLLGVSDKKTLLSTLRNCVYPLAKSLCICLSRSDPVRDGYRGKLS